MNHIRLYWYKSDAMDYTAIHNLSHMLAVRHIDFSAFKKFLEDRYNDMVRNDKFTWDQIHYPVFKFAQLVALYVFSRIVKDGNSRKIRHECAKLIVASAITGFMFANSKIETWCGWVNKLSGQENQIKLYTEIAKYAEHQIDDLEWNPKYWETPTLRCNRRATWEFNQMLELSKIFNLMSKCFCSKHE